MPLLKNGLVFFMVCLVVCSFSACSLYTSDSDFLPIQNDLQWLLDKNQLSICGTFEQFLRSPDDTSNLSSYQPTDFVCSKDVPLLYNCFSNSQVVLTGRIPIHPPSEDLRTNTIEPFHTEEPLNNDIHCFRGYIKTPEAHYEGIFQYYPPGHIAVFTIANSLLERIHPYEE
ncbi:MAG: hypothetical protein PHX86_00765 [Caldisericia bacterium]|nr:hypothetical protein [Caldisericia bacterium]